MNMNVLGIESQSKPSNLRVRRIQSESVIDARLGCDKKRQYE